MFTFMEDSMAKPGKIISQFTLPNNKVVLSRSKDSLVAWMEAYFNFEVTTLPSSQKEQRRDIQLLISFVVEHSGNDHVDNWTPRLSAAFRRRLQTEIKDGGSRHWNDRSVNRILAHNKTFAKWIHKLRPFILGNPMDKIKSVPTASLLSIERAITPTERRRILDAADLLIKTGGRSKDRKRFGNIDVDERPVRKGYRPYRNRAVVYALIETGMRRAAVVNINIADVNFEAGSIATREKGASMHTYTISKEGIKAIADYVNNERSIDQEVYKSAALFLPSFTTPNESGRLHPNAVNDIWREICKRASVKGRTPHSARHSMGRHIIERTGNVSAVQRQLGHKNAAYSLQYARITTDELKAILDERD